MFQSSHVLERRTSIVGKRNSRLVSLQESIEAKRNISVRTSFVLQQYTLNIF